MRLLTIALLLILLPLQAAWSASTARGKHFSAEIVSQQATLKAGTKNVIALVIHVDRGWHIYWPNPGDAGYEPILKWQLPTGFVVGELHHPVPRSLVISGIGGNVHVGEAVLLQDIASPAALSAGVVANLLLNLDMAICSETTCVPDGGKFELELLAGDGDVDPGRAELFKRAFAALPDKGGAGAKFRLAGGKAEIFLPAINLASGDTAHVFGAEKQQLSDVAEQQFDAATGGSIASVALGKGKIGEKLPLLLRIEGKDGRVRGLEFVATSASSLPEKRGGAGGFVGALLAAVLGGLLLNLMPCVFPILSLKALSLARAGGDAAEARREALGYAIGAIATVLALGATLLALRSGGSALGWAFQLQDSRVVALLLLLVTAIALNLAGLFEVRAPGIGGTGKAGFVGSIITGALAAFIATPCTAPFMAGALGAALLMPVPSALAVFFGLGLGIALPFLLVGYWAPARRWLPKPGNWMVTLRRILSLPMLATAVGLAWILGRQSGANGMALALAATVLLGAALWWLGLRQRGGKSALLPMVVAALTVLISLSVGKLAEESKPALALSQKIMPYSAEKLASLRGQRKPVFLYMTADWCLSCKVNEATSLSNNDVKVAFAKAGVTVMRGDWTRPDPAIAAFLREKGLAGIPVYYWYPAHGEPKAMPQILTPTMLIGLVDDS